MKNLLEWLCTLPILKKLFTPDSLAQFFRYIFVGVLCFSIEYTLFIVLRNIIPIGEVMVNILVYTIIFWLNFLLNKFFSFKSKTNFKRQLILYGILFFFNLIVGNILLFSAIRYILAVLSGEGSWQVLYLPKILIMFFIISWNFILYKKVIYK
ncbi:MAG: GtrA family protein [Clostridiaceae bacterium]|jgi:putative flippase GtrA|nr:GtrA family protein [Clostridiaceae bacterium]